jgi:peptide methionine sulfoxide reductase MsrB
VATRASNAAIDEADARIQRLRRVKVELRIEQRANGVFRHQAGLIDARRGHVRTDQPVMATEALRRFCINRANADLGRKLG